MHKKVVIIIQSDPRISHRPCEGIRIALGLVASEHHVSILLIKKAVHLLAPDKTDFVDEEHLEHFLSAFENFPVIFFIDAASYVRCDFPVEETGAVLLSQAAGAEKIAAADCFFTF